MAKSLLRRFFLLVAVALLAGCALSYPVADLPTAEEAPNFYRPQVEAQYRLQVGDGIAIRSYYDSQLNQEMVVRPDGRISVMLMGELKVVGMAPEELAGQIGKHYSRILNGTDVTVVLTHSANMNIFLSGELKNPSLLSLEGDLTLLQAVARSGGFLSSANTESVLLIRSLDEGKLEVRKINIEKILRNEAPDVYLRRRDVVFVPKSDIAQVGLFVDQYINAIVPRFVQVQFGWFRTTAKNKDPAVVITQ